MIITDLSTKLARLGTVYPDNIPKGFTRPSMLIETVRQSREDATRHTLLYTHEYLISAFPPIDEYGNEKQAEMNAMLDAIMDIFSVGAIRINGEYVHCEAKLSGEGYVTATLQYRADRPKEQTGGDYPLMQTVNIKKEQTSNGTSSD